MRAKSENPVEGRGSGGNETTHKIEIKKIMPQGFTNINSIFISRRAFFRAVLPWAGLITLTAYTTTKSRWLDRVVWRAER